MLLVSFLLWLCGMCCDLCAVTAFTTACSAAAGDGHCGHGSGSGGEKVTAFSGVPPVVFWVFFLYDTAFLFLPLPFLLLSLLATSVAAVCNYTRHWEKGRR